MKYLDLPEYMTRRGDNLLSFACFSFVQARNIWVPGVTVTQTLRDELAPVCADYGVGTLTD
jgi:hypothetical protein